ncbi:MAG: hypothetical protein ACYCV4_05375 [Dermatophilaceae bacterium]
MTEPQRHTWIDLATGYRCLVLKNRWWCGYVEVPADHPWHGMPYNGSDDIPYNSCPEAVIEVHGGITFSGERTAGDRSGGWWFGFDCAHVEDEVDYGPGVPLQPGHRWTLNEVREQCEKMAVQLKDQAS